MQAFRGLAKLRLGTCSNAILDTSPAPALRLRPAKNVGPRWRLCCRWNGQWHTSSPSLLHAQQQGQGEANFFRSAILCLNFSSFSHMYRKKNDREIEYAVDRHFNNPLKKHLDYEDNSEKSLEEIAREQEQKIRNIKKARAARDFKEEPEKRTLPWDTIDQIRYLREDDPAEWSVTRLAESFNVSEGVIVRVLKSKFTPSQTTKQKQDRAAGENSGNVVAGSATALVEADSKTGPPPFTSGGDPKRRDKQQKRNMTGDQRYKNEKVLSENAPKVEQQPKRRRDSRGMEHGQRSHQHPAEKKLSSGRDEGEQDAELDFTFGRIDFENVDSLAAGQLKLKPKVLKKGRNYYNENGEFLYRI